MSVGQFRGMFDILQCGVRLSVGNVLCHAGAEQKRILEHDAYFLTERFPLVVGKVHAVDANSSALRLVESKEQAGDR